MRKVFINTLIEVAEKDKRIFLLTGDLGFSVLEPFRENFPDRFFNMGVAEQNMIGVAAGLALSGKIVFCYSIVPFVTMRCFEQIRNDLCFQNLNVRLVGVGGGIEYGPAGFSHYAREDIAIMRSLTNMTVVVPANDAEVKSAIQESIKYPGPIYIRLGKDVPLNLNFKKFRIGKATVLKRGKDIAIISGGSILSLAREIVESLEQHNLSCSLINMPTVKPIDVNLLIDLIRRQKAIFVIEDHNIIGGLGSAVAEVVAEAKNKIIFKRFGLPDYYHKFIGRANFLLKRYGLSAEDITKKILQSLKGI